MLILTTFILWLSLHPIHVTNTSVDYAAEKGEIAVFVMLYYDDFLLDYRKLDTTVNISEYIDDETFPEEKMTCYINERLFLSADDRKLEGELTNMTLSNNEMRVSFVYKVTKSFTRLLVNNGLLADLYDDQANMTIVKLGDYEEGIKFTPQFREKIFKVNR